MEDWSDQEKDLASKLVSLYCDPSEYSQLGSLFLTDSDTAIKQLFHFRELGNNAEPTFSSISLCLFYILYAILTCINYGTAVPSGMFVPSLLQGAAFGRLIGHLLHTIDGRKGTFADSGTFALVGAAAGLGGMARMTISLTVIILEATGDVQYVVPLMVTVMFARFAGNIYNEGLYDIHIHLKNMPFLEESDDSDNVSDAILPRHVKCT
jgi:chloride channel 7